MNNTLLARLCEGDSLLSSISRDTLSANETREKENFDDWYIMTLFIHMGNAVNGLFSL